MARVGTFRLAGTVIALGLAAVAGSTARQGQPIAVAVDAAEVRRSQVSPEQARQIDLQVSRLQPTRAIDTRRETQDSASPPNAVSAPVTLPIRTSELSVPPAAVVQYVPTSPALERRIARALASQPAIRRELTGQATMQALPGVLRQLDRAGEVVQLKAYVLTGRRLVFDAADGRFAGTILLGVSDIEPGQPRRSLSTPVNFQVIGADAAEPPQISIERTSPPFHEVTLRMTSARAVRVASDLIPEGVEIDLPLSPILTIEAGNSSIEGLGLGTTDLNISAIGITQPERQVVTLQTDRGFLDSTRVRLDSEGNATVTIRSDDIGRAGVRASSPGLAPATTDVSFRLPYITLIASILGGIVGGVVRGGRSLRRLGVSALTGIIVFAAYAIGINLLPFAPSVTVGATFVFAVSALGAILGPALFRRRISA